MKLAEVGVCVWGGGGWVLSLQILNHNMRHALKVHSAVLCLNAAL